MTKAEELIEKHLKGKSIKESYYGDEIDFGDLVNMIEELADTVEEQFYTHGDLDQREDEYEDDPKGWKKVVDNWKRTEPHFKKLVKLMQDAVKLSHKLQSLQR